MRPSVDLTGMVLFVKIVESGSISAASRTLGVPKSSLSRQLSLWEERLGTALLTRSTRAITLTDFGRHYFERVRPIVHDAEQAQIEAESQHAKPTGTLSISVPRAYGSMIVAPRLFDFSRKYPSVRLDLHVSDERVNLIAEGFDLAVRAGVLEDSELISRKLQDLPMVMVASPAYLEHAGVPTMIEDLTSHRVIVTRADIDHWTLDNRVVRVTWTISTGDITVTRDAAKAGIGIALVPYFLVTADLENGHLVRVLPRVLLPTGPVSLLYARTKTPSPALSALVDYLLGDTAGRTKRASIAGELHGAIVEAPYGDQDKNVQNPAPRANG